jgi:alpha,alpha-trehalose phosphorylase
MSPMIGRHNFRVDPWSVTEERLDLDVLAQTESVFALSNGHIGIRGNLDEGEPHGIPGTYLNSVFELRSLPYAEAGYGYPESGQTVVNVTNGKVIRLLVDDEPFDVRYGTLREHVRTLDLRAGTLHRSVEWVSPIGRSIRVRSTRMVSLVQRAAAAICYEVEPVDSEVRLVLQSELVANEGDGVPQTGDPRAAAELEAPLVPEEHVAGAGQPRRAVLVHHTRRSGLRVAAAMDHEVTGPEGLTVSMNTHHDLARLAVVCTLPPGQRLRIVKYLGYGWSSVRSRAAMHDQVIAAVDGAMASGWEAMLDEQRRALDEFWSRADVEVDGDPDIQQAVRFGLFHVLQAGFRGEHRPIPAKGLTGPGYDGHAFWDTETFVLPVLTYTQPEAAADALRWRRQTLPAARERARQLGLSGAAFPWRTIDGAECSAYWPAGTAAFHVNGDIAAAVVRLVDATEDDEFAATVGLELLVETARMWVTLGHHTVDGGFHIAGVTGPDEYSALADDNVYTNLLAELNLRAAADYASRYPEAATELGVGDEEIAAWRTAAENVHVPYDERLGVHPQSEGFTRHPHWDFASTGAQDYPLMLHFPYFQLYRKQVVKQADLVLAMAVRGDRFSQDEKTRNFDYYEQLTVRDSSLSACTQAVMAAEVGSLGLAYRYLGEASLMDLDDLEHNTRDGVHIASLAGSWVALVTGFGGMRCSPAGLAFAPRLPEELQGMAFRMFYRGRRLLVSVCEGSARYELLSGEPLTVLHHGEQLKLTGVGEPVARPVPPTPWRQPPRQPPGREPEHRTPPAYGDASPG